jgi:hypothetical protein
MMINQLEWLRKMVTIRNHNLGIIRFNRNNDPLPLPDGVNFFTVYNDPDVQKTEQYLFFAGNDNIIGLSNKFLFQ